MKNKILFIGSILFTAFSSNATILTVDNNPNAPGGVYATIQNAIDIASNGDSIYVVGSASQYGAFTSTKKIHIFGAGHNPDKQYPYATNIAGYSTFTVTGTGTVVTGDASGSTIEGVILDNLTLSGYSLTHKLSNITVSRCRILGNNINLGGYISDIIIKNNIIRMIYGGNYSSNIVITNNIIQTFVNIGDYINSGTILCSNNLLMTSAGAISNIKNTILSNNIFYKYSPNSANNSYCTYNNNISFGSSNDVFNLTGSNTGGGNLQSTDPLFTSITGAGLVYTAIDDYNLQASSPGKNAGTDGTDIGIYGGAYPWPDGGLSGSGFMYSQEADIPQTNQMNIQNAVVPLNGTLNILVKGITNH